MTIGEHIASKKRKRSPLPKIWGVVNMTHSYLLNAMPPVGEWSGQPREWCALGSVGE